MAMQEFVQWSCDRNPCAETHTGPKDEPPFGWHALSLDGLDPNGLSLGVKLYMCPGCSKKMADGLRKMQANAQTARNAT